MAEASPLLDFSKNVNQAEFYRTVVGTVAKFQAGKETEGQELRQFFYGGGIRGGKTTVCISLMILAAAKFPGFRGHIVRETMTSLEATTLVSFRKFCPPNLVRAFRGSGTTNYRVEFHNGSVIHFFPEMSAGDKDLDRFKGLETNWIMLEQLEELQYATYMKCIERMGSWYIDPMPPGLILATFNPTFGWLKETIYDKWRTGELRSPYYYQNALPKDNPFVTRDQERNWKSMDDVNYARFVEGDWESRDTTGLFAYAFNTNKHVAFGLEYQPGLPLWLSFDFNVDPMTCIAAQHGANFVRVLREWRVPNIGIEEFLKYHIQPWLQAEVPDARVMVTGDPSGANRSGMNGNTNYYIVIHNLLGLPKASMLPDTPHEHEAGRVHFNSVVSRLPSLQVDAGCKYLLQDLASVRMRPDGKIDKPSGANRASGRPGHENGHLLDCLRYYLHRSFPNFVSDRLS